MRIRDLVAFVTGANRGLGLAFVKELLAAGARKVYAAARHPERITLDGVDRVRLDVTKPDSIAAAASECTDVNLLINNAGVNFWLDFPSRDAVEAARSEMETNYFGPLALSRAFAPVLAKNGGGAIVNVLSVLSWVTVQRRDVQRFQGRRVGVDELATGQPARPLKPGEKNMSNSQWFGSSVPGAPRRRNQV